MIWPPECPILPRPWPIGVGREFANRIHCDSHPFVEFSTRTVPRRPAEPAKLEITGHDTSTAQSPHKPPIRHARLNTNLPMPGTPRLPDHSPSARIEWIGFSSSPARASTILPPRDESLP